MSNCKRELHNLHFHLTINITAEFMLYNLADFSMGFQKT